MRGYIVYSFVGYVHTVYKRIYNNARRIATREQQTSLDKWKYVLDYRNYRLDVLDSLTEQKILYWCK